jgi:D-sedoheptulose 7-phosphate isomerase
MVATDCPWQCPLRKDPEMTVGSDLAVTDAADAVAATLHEAASLFAAMAADRTLCAAVVRAAAMVTASLRAGGKLMLCGNGGSAADAQHWATELVGRFHHDRPGLAAVALTADGTALTALGNDYGYERIFARQVEALGRPGDVLFALSTSGRSPSILAALAAARAGGIATIGFTGAAGTAMEPLCDLLLRVPHAETPRIQEGHEALGHAICGLIEAALFPHGG